MDPKTTSMHFLRIKPKIKLVYLFTLDHKFGEFLSQQVSHFGYSMQVVKDISELEKAATEYETDAVVVDVSSVITGDTTVDIFKELSISWESRVALLFVSDHDDQETRIKAIRAGGTAFFIKPIDIFGLIDKLDNLQVGQILECQRVLIVEDQIPIANYYQMVLKHAGIDAELVIDAASFLQKMVEYHPDLILMDLSMPGIDGFELTKLLRQMDEFASIPIVFLSGDDDFDNRMEALRSGGDDILTKPIKASHLVGLVKIRLERLRTLRSYMVRDSLTGLINHTTFRSMLAQEINRCKRQAGSLSLVVLDLDHFKRVNDTYGYSIGDSVIKSLSRLLKQRLRNSDIIGRYGGEEFVVLLQDIECHQAFSVMDEIREHFAEIDHHSVQDGPIFVTFSCGIATFPEFPNAKRLSDAAENAMNAAKAAGRNRIVIAKM